MSISRKNLVSLAALTLGSTVLTFLLGYVAFIVLAHQSLYSAPSLSIWNRWDTFHYLYIAEHGYSAAPAIPSERFSIAFLWGYPFAIKVVSLIFQNYLFSALLVSQIAYTAAVFYLYALVRLDFPQATAFRAAIYFSFYPTAYFLHAGYTESFFLMGALGAFYHARKGQWLTAALLGCFASSSKTYGITLLLALVIECLGQAKWDFSKIPKRALFLAIIPIPFIIHIVINVSVYGDPLRFVQVLKENWYYTPAPPWKFLISGLSHPPFPVLNARQLTESAAPLVFGLVSLGMIIASFWQLRRLSYLAYMAAIWISFTSWNAWFGVPRYTVLLFPMFIQLALLGRRPIFHALWLFLSITFYVFFCALFVRGYWAF